MDRALSKSKHSGYRLGGESFPDRANFAFGATGRNLCLWSSTGPSRWQELALPARLRPLFSDRVWFQRSSGPALRVLVVCGGLGSLVLLVFSHLR